MGHEAPEYRVLLVVQTLEAGRALRQAGLVPRGTVTYAIGEAASGNRYDGIVIAADLRGARARDWYWSDVRTCLIPDGFIYGQEPAP